MPEHVRKGLYFTNKLVLDKLDQVENQSKYVEGLILKDIVANGNKNNYEDTVNETIDSILQQIDLIRNLLRDKK